MPELMNSPAEQLDDTEGAIAVYPSENSGQLGRVLINPEVIASIAAMAAREIDGVRLRGGVWNKITSPLTGGTGTPGVAVVQNDNGHYTVVLEVLMAYRTPMRETAEKMQRHIKDTVERMVSLELESVDVKIVDIFKDKEREKEAEE